MKMFSIVDVFFLACIEQEPSLRGGGRDMSLTTFGQGGHNIFSPQHFVIKNNVVLRISWLLYYGKASPT